MSFSFIVPALLVVSALTNLSVEALKKLLDESGTTYSSNVLAVVVSIVISAVTSAFYLILNGIPFTAIIAVQVAALMYLSFLVATLGYDKVMQLIEQISNVKRSKSK